MIALFPRRLGCLGGLLAVTVLGAVVYFGILAVFAPWSFFMGGEFHLIPGWWAWGRVHSPVEGDYFLYVQLDPWTRGRRVAPLKGWGYVCSPRGEITALGLYAYMPRPPWLDTDIDGTRMSVDMSRRPSFWSFSNDRRPEIHLRGQWHNPALELDDGGSISRAFTPEGLPYLGPRKGQPKTRWTGHVSLRAGSYSDFAAACQANARR